MEQEIERRAEELARQQRRRPGHNAPMIPLVLGSLGIAIPLMGIAGGTAGFPGILAVCIAIVLVNLLLGDAQLVAVRALRLLAAA